MKNKRKLLICELSTKHNSNCASCIFSGRNTIQAILNQQNASSRDEVQMTEFRVCQRHGASCIDSRRKRMCLYTNIQVHLVIRLQRCFMINSIFRAFWDIQILNTCVLSYTNGLIQLNYTLLGEGILREGTGMIATTY